jgi:undecaprenyl-diphosphatase
MLAELLQWDIDLFWLINGHHNALSDAFFSIITNFGNAWIVLPLIAGIIIRKTPRQHVRRVLVFALISLALSGISTQAMKQAICRPRPLRYFVTVERPPESLAKPRFKESYTTDRGVHVVGTKLRYRSFPSGHTSTAFSFAVLLIVLYRRWLWLALIPAALVAWSRVYLGAHFPLDTVAGAFVGSATVLATLLFYRPWPSAGREKPAGIVEKVPV